MSTSPALPSPRPLRGALSDWRAALGNHYLRLGAWSRQRRFLAPLGDRSVQRIADMAKPDAVLATTVDGRTRGVLELYCTSGAHAEIAISVEDAYQGRGHGRRLFEAGLALARDRDVKTANLLFAKNNHGIRHMVEKAGGVIVSRGADWEARIDLARIPADA